jgi:hypothetical protein
LQNCLSSSDENDENEHEDEDDSLVVIDKSKNRLSQENWQASTGISGLHGMHLPPYIRGATGLNITVGVVLNCRCRELMATD